MSTTVNGPSNNGARPQSWSQSWTHLGVGEDLPGRDRVGGRDQDTHPLQLQLWLLAARVVRRCGRVHPVALQQAHDQLRLELAGHDRHCYGCPGHLVLAIPANPGGCLHLTIAPPPGAQHP